MSLFKKNYLVNISLLVFSIVISIYSTEFFLSKKILDLNPKDYLHQERIKIAKEKKINFDERSKIQVLDDTRKTSNKTVVLSAAIRLFKENGYRDNLITPLAGVSNSNTVFCNEEGEWVLYESDNYGFNNPNTIYQSKLNIALLGDSYIHGSCMKKNEDLASIMRNKKTNIANFGIEGSSAAIQLAVIEEYIKPLKPEKVYWFYYEGNDLVSMPGKNINLRRTSFLSKFLDDYMDSNFSQNLMKRQKEIDSEYLKFLEISENNQRNKMATELQNDSFESIIRLKNIRGIISMVSTNRFFRDHNNQIVFQYARNSDKNMKFEIKDSEIDQYIKILKEGKKRVEKWGGKITIVYLPSWFRYAPEDLSRRFSKNIPYLAFRERFILKNNNDLFRRGDIKQKIKENNIDIIDFTDKFNNHDNVMSLFPLGLYGHYTKKGFDIIADHLKIEILK